MKDLENSFAAAVDQPAKIFPAGNFSVPLFAVQIPQNKQMISYCMMSKSSLLERVKKLLESKEIFVRDEWLEECLALVGDATSPNVVVEQVYQQFLHSDISDAIKSPPSVLNDVESIHQEFLQGPFILQMNELVNISESLEHRDTGWCFL